MKQFAEALKTNTSFKGPLSLRGNGLTDLSALYLSDAMKVNQNISELDLAHNNFKDRAGVYIGEVFSANPSYPLVRICFEGIDLQEMGVRRVAESLNSNTNIKSVHLGTLDSTTLTIFAENLA